MRNFERYQPQLMLKHWTDKRTGASGIQPVGQFYRRFDDLTSSSIVKGDFHSPYPWTFNKRHRENFMEAGYEDANVREVFVGPYWNMPEGLNTWHTNELALATSDALARMNEEIRGSLDLSVDLAQLRQTLRIVKDLRKIVDRTVILVADTLMRKGNVPLPSSALKRAEYRKRLIARLNQRYHAGQKANGFDILKVPGELQLQYSYGVRPTLQSMHDTIHGLANHYYGFSKVFMGKSTRKRVDTLMLPNYPDGSWNCKVVIQSSVRSLIKVRLAVEDEPLSRIAQFTSLNPGSIAWELLPWSFVVDWVYNVGDYLRSVETAFVYDRYFKSGFSTNTWDYRGVLDGRRSAIPGAFGSYWCTSRDAHLTRTVLGSFPYPDPPKVDINLGASRLLNAAALLTTFLGRQPRNLLPVTAYNFGAFLCPQLQQLPSLTGRPHQ